MEKDLTPFEAAEIAGRAERSRVAKEIDRGDWRRLAERACISLLNKHALEETVEDWRNKYEETQDRLIRMENLLASFQAELQNQKNTMVRALHVKYGNGPTS